jgi:eukaryotic-like serine/threonine-protein kinase
LLSIEPSRIFGTLTLMTPDRLARISAVFNLILDQKPEDRPPMMDAIRREDPELCDEVEKLIRVSTETSVGAGTQGGPDPTKTMTRFAVDNRPSEVRQLNPGDVLSGRFTIIQFLARGGMGEVYEAADSHLQNKHCALKTVRSDIVSDPLVRQRFEREVLLAREVTHPNVCPTFDLFRVEGPRGPLLFLTMKLLHGESLAARLHRAGAYDPDSALPIIRQMAAGLDAAHRAGVIHRDFKPGNVMLEGIGSDTRVSITDFGLSRAFQSDYTHAQTGRVSGTFGYIAPELLHGATATPASDVYAFGVVVHEMLTGKRPVLKTGALRFLPPSHFVKGLPRAWDRMVLGCLEADRAKRFQSADEALSVIEHRSASTRSAKLRVPISPWRRFGLAGVGTAVVAAVSWFSLANLDSILHPLPQKRFVALMQWPAEPNSQYGPLLKNVMATTGNHLARVEASAKDLLIISPMDVTGQAPPQSPSETVGALGANLVLAASARPRHDGVTLSLKVLDATTQKVLREKELDASALELGLLPERAASASAKLLDVTAAQTRTRDPDQLAGVPPEAYLRFTAAEDLLDQPSNTGLDQAIEKYQKTLELAPDFGLAYAKLSIAYVRKFSQSQDRAVLKLAERNADLAMKYNPDSTQTLLSRALVDANSGRAQQAIDELGKALQFDPRNPEVLLEKARTLRDLDRRAEEEGLYRGILVDRPNYWPAYNELGLVLYRHGDYQKAAEAFAEGCAVAPKVALLQTNLGTMNLLLNRKKEAEEAFLRSLEREPNEIAYQNLGAIAFAAGNYRKALGYYTKARDLRPGRDSTWRNIADCYAMLGDTERQNESYRKAAEMVSDALRLNPNPGSSWMNLAFYQAKLGLRGDAEMSLRQAESHGAGDMQSQFKQAQVLALLGKKEEALRQVLDCMSKGLSPAEVDLALDLNEVRKDPRYKRQLALAKPKTEFSAKGAEQ